MDFNIKKDFPVYMTHVESEGPYLKLFGQADKQGALAIESFINNERARLEHGIGIVPPSSLRPGLMCIAQYNDEKYYRARINSLHNIEAGYVSVYFIDFGNIDSIPAASIRLLDAYPDVLQKLPPQASDYLLSSIINLGVWEEHALTNIRNLLYYQEVSCTVELNIYNKSFVKIKFRDQDLADYLVSCNYGTKFTLQDQQFLLQKMLSGTKGGSQLVVQPQPFMKAKNPARFPGEVYNTPNENTSQAYRIHMAQNSPHHDPATRSVLPESTTSNRNKMRSVNAPRPLNRPTEESKGHYQKPESAKMIQPNSNMSINNPVLQKNPSTYKSRFLELNSQHQVHVSFAKDGPKLFAIQLQSDENFLTSIVSQINSQPPKCLSEPPMIGSVCLGRFSEDNTLCRAVIMGLTPSQCKLFFIDFGMTESVSHSNIFDIPEEFVTPCVFALRFSLSGLMGLQITEEIKNEFYEIVNNKVLTLRVVPPEGPPLIQYCELSLNGESVRDMLLQKQNPSFLKIDPSSIAGEHSVLVSYVDSCTKFFIQLSDNIDALNTMMEAVEVYCQNAKPLLYHQVKYGMVCCALFPDDQNWYRASVTNIKKDKITVNYIDYGNDQEVTCDSLRPITPELVKMRAQAIHCALKEFEVKPFDQLTSDNLEALTLEKILCMRVQGLLEGGVLLVELLDQSTNPPIHIARAIKEAVAASLTSVPQKEFNESQGSVESSPDFAKNNYKGGKPSYSDKSLDDKSNENHFRSNRQFDRGDGNLSQGGRSHDKYPEREQRTYENQREQEQRKFAHQQRGNPDPSYNSKTRYQKPYGRAEKTNSPGGVVSQYHRESSKSDRFYKAQIGDNKSYSERKEYDSERKPYSERREYDGERKPYSERKEYDSEKKPYSERKEYDGERKPYAERKEYDSERKPYSERREYDGERKPYSERKEYDGERKPYSDRKPYSERKPYLDRNTEDSSWENKSSDTYSSPPAKTLSNPVAFETPFGKHNLDDQVQDVRVTWFINPNDFYVQILAQEEQFKNMMTSIPSLYSGVKANSSDIPTGASVLARFPEDKVLYRAVVLDSSWGKIIVQFVDFGNKCQVTANDIWQLESELMTLPAQAVHCSLKGILPPDNAWKKNTQVDEYFNSHLHKCAFHQQTEDIYSVSLTKEDGTDVGQKLVANNLALNDSESTGEVPESAVTVFVTHVDTPGQFWLQLETDSEKIDSLQESLQTADTFEDYVDHEVGTLCVAKYSADEQFYRTIILDSDNDIITVRFIDYGNTDVLDNTAGVLKRLPTDMQDIEPYAIKCSVNATPTGTGQWTEQASEQFTHLLGNTENPVDAVFILKGAMTYVNLYIEGQNTTDKLIEAGHAARAVKSDGDDLPTCFASHVNSPTEFWIQLESSILDLEAIAEELVAADEFPPLSEIAEEAICAAKFPEDDLWYRAQVIIHGNDGTEVLFMDYGNASLTNELRSLPDNLKNLPALSRKCALQKPGNIKNWSKEAEMKFAELAADGATIFHITFIASGDISIVELFVDGKSVTEELISLCDLSANTPSPDRDRLPLIGEDKMSPVCICYSNCPGDFWVHYMSSTTNLDIITETLEDAENFEPFDDIAEGALCVSIFPEDSLWYRSKVIDHGENGTQVFHIDFGSTAVTTELRVLPKSLCELPPLAKHCSLLIPHEITKHNQKFHENFAQWALDDSQEYHMDIIDSSVDPMTVKLFLNGQDIVELLIDTDQILSQDIKMQEDVDETGDETVIENPDDAIEPLPTESCDNSPDKQANIDEASQSYGNKPVDKQEEATEACDDIVMEKQEDVKLTEYDFIVTQTFEQSVVFTEDSGDVENKTDIIELEAKNEAETFEQSVVFTEDSGDMENKTDIIELEAKNEAEVIQLEAKNVTEDNCEEENCDKSPKTSDDSLENLDEGITDMNIEEYRPTESISEKEERNSTKTQEHSGDIFKSPVVEIDYCESEGSPETETETGSECENHISEEKYLDLSKELEMSDNAAEKAKSDEESLAEPEVADESMRVLKTDDNLLDNSKTDNDILEESKTIYKSLDTSKSESDTLEVSKDEKDVLEVSTNYESFEVDRSEDESEEASSPEDKCKAAPKTPVTTLEVSQNLSEKIKNDK